MFFDLPPAFQLSTLEWGIAVIAIILLGFSKSGFKGISIILVTLLALVFGGKASTGILLPLLTAADILAVIYYNRHTQRKYLIQLLPWMMLGVVLGAWLGADLPEQQFKQGMAVIVLISVIMMYWWDQKKAEQVPQHWLFGGTMGLMAGFTTMIGNLAGAFVNVFFLAMRVPKNEFIGTTAWIFFIINLFKLPFHIFVWKTVTIDTLKVDAILVAAISIGFFIGVELIKKIENAQYRKFILIVTALGALLILYKSFF